MTVIGRRRRGHSGSFGGGGDPPEVIVNAVNFNGIDTTLLLSGALAGALTDASSSPSD